jgi:type I restriction enzyme S subunit
MNPELLLAYFDRISETPDAIPRLRSFVLDLAVRGKLVEQDPKDEPAAELLKRMQAEKGRLVKDGKLSKQQPVAQIGVQELPFLAPSGWEWARLATISRRIHYGYTASANPSLRDVRMLRITDIQNNLVDWPSVPGCEISEREVEQYKLRQGDILIARTGGTIGKTFLVGQIPVTAVFASYLIRVQKSSEFYDRYLKFFLESPVYWKQLQDGARGGGQPNVNGQTLGRMTVAVPPLAEQNRIVAKVDELMALCDRLEATQRDREARRDRLSAASIHHLNNAADTEAFRQSADFFISHLPRLTVRSEEISALRSTILSLAFRGQLAHQNSADESAFELLKHIQARKALLVKEGKIKLRAPLPPIPENMVPFQLPEGWLWVRFGDLIEDADAGWSPKSENFSRSGDNWGVLKVSAVSWNRFLPEENKQLLPGVTPPEAAQVHAGDFLISRANTSELVAKSVIVEEKPKNLILSDKIVRLQISEICNKRFLGMINNHAAYARSYYAEEASGTSFSMKNVSRNVIYLLPVPLAPLAEQHRIVARVDELMAVCDRLDVQLTMTQSAKRSLLESILFHVLNGNDRERHSKQTMGTKSIQMGVV